MKTLHNLLEKIKPHFTKGGKLEKLHVLYDGIYTFLFVPNHVTEKGTHIKDSIDLKRTMFMVIIAMLPALIVGMWNIGYQHYLAIGQTATMIDNLTYGLVKLLPIIVVSYVVGLSIEFLFAGIRKHSINEGFLVSGMLIPLILPVEIPLWQVAVATAFAVVIGKEVFGGTGMNIVNVALTARAFLFFAYPSFMSGDKIWVALDQADKTVDGYSGETLLAQAVKNGDKFHDIVGQPISIMDAFIGNIPGSIGETSTIAILLGGAFLLFTGVASWRIMLSVFLGGYLMGLIFNMFGHVSPYFAMPAHYHLVLGGFAFGAVFMATDPVTAAQTNKGKWIYGILVGMFAIMIRVFNPAYPEGMMLAILLMNISAPLIDHFVIEGNIKRRLNRLKTA